MDTVIINLDGDLWEIEEDDLEFIVESLCEQYDLDHSVVEDILYQYGESLIDSFITEVL